MEDLFCQNTKNRKAIFNPLINSLIRGCEKFKILTNNTALQKKKLKYTIDEYDIFLNVFLAAESDSDIRFLPSRLDFAAHEVTIFRKQ